MLLSATIASFGSSTYYLLSVCMSKGKKKSYKCMEYAERLGFSAFPLLQLHSHSLAFRFLALFHIASVEEVHRHGSENEALTA